MAPKKLKITQDTDLEALLDEPGWVSEPASRLAEIQKAAQESLALRKLKGGVRPGAGRKPLPPAKRRVQLTVSVKPETAKRFRSLAKKSRLSLGAVLDRQAATIKFK